jgi:protein involved in plasmid replication-relaxation
MSRSSYLTQARLAELASSLSARDHDVLSTLATVRLASGAQLTRLHLNGLSPRRARTVLEALADYGLIVRLPRSVGGVRAGSAGFVYALGIGGWQLLVGPGRRRRPPLGVGTLFVRHTLAVTEVYVGLREAERAGRLTLARYVGEPATWRSFSGPGGGRAWLKPDAAVTVQLGSYLDDYWLEVDRATESTTTIARTCDRYRAYWQTGRAQADGGVFPQVLWLVPDEHRYEQIVNVLARQPEAAWKLFTVALQRDAITRIASGVTS